MRPGAAAASHLCCSRGRHPVLLHAQPHYPRTHTPLLLGGRRCRWTRPTAPPWCVTCRWRCAPGAASCSWGPTAAARAACFACWRACGHSWWGGRGLGEGAEGLHAAASVCACCAGTAACCAQAVQQGAGRHAAAARHARQHSLELPPIPSQGACVRAREGGRAVSCSRRPARMHLPCPPPPQAGEITSPPKGRLFYLSQRPYLVVGSLRDQLLYPRPPGVVWAAARPADKKQYMQVGRAGAQHSGGGGGGGEQICPTVHPPCPSTCACRLQAARQAGVDQDASTTGQDAGGHPTTGHGQPAGTTSLPQLPGTRPPCSVGSGAACWAHRLPLSCEALKACPGVGASRSPPTTTVRFALPLHPTPPRAPLRIHPWVCADLEACLKAVELDYLLQRGSGWDQVRGGRAAAAAARQHQQQHSQPRGGRQRMCCPAVCHFPTPPHPSKSPARPT